MGTLNPTHSLTRMRDKLSEYL